MTAHRPEPTSTDGRTLIAHVALALGNHAKNARRDGMAVPVEIDALAALLLDAVSSRQGSSSRDGVLSADDSRPVIEPELLTRGDVARVLRCSLSTVDRLLSAGTLPSVELAGPRVRRSDLAAYVAGLPTRPAGGTPGAFRDSIRSKGAGAAPAAAAAGNAAAACTAGTGPLSISTTHTE